MDNLNKEYNNLGIKEERTRFRIEKDSWTYLIWTYVFWILLSILFFIWIFDFTRTISDKQPKFHLKETVHVYEDGKVEEYIGLGYKVFRYERSSLGLKNQFTPFFVKMKE